MNVGETKPLMFEAYKALHHPEQITNVIFLPRFLSFLFKPMSCKQC